MTFPEHSRLGLRIREIRETRRWSMDDLAERSRTSRSHIHRLENALDMRPQASKIAAVLSALGMSKAELRRYLPERADEIGRWMTAPVPKPKPAPEPIAIVPAEPVPVEPEPIPEPEPVTIAFTAAHALAMESALHGSCTLVNASEPMARDPHVMVLVYDCEPVAMLDGDQVHERRLAVFTDARRTTSVALSARVVGCSEVVSVEPVATEPPEPSDWWQGRWNGRGPEPYLRKTDLADVLGVSDRTINRWHHEGLPFVRSGGINLYRMSEVEAWLEGRQQAS